jgi:PAS domain S-box-containing protein
MVDIGPVDCSVPLVLCDLQQPDHPIVYASDAFLVMTGYRKTEVLGRNCRFLQVPGGRGKAHSSRRAGDAETTKSIRRSVQRNTEFQTKIVNYKKDGTKFTNFLTMIPVQWQGDQYTYSIGFQCELDD